MGRARPSGRTRILGIDPGLVLTGYGCVDLAEPAAEPTIVEAGVLRLDRGRPMYDRLVQLDEDLGAVLDELAPDRLVVEALFSHYRHARTAIRMAHARGVVMLAGRRRGLEVGELVATEVKRAVVGNGHASKRQVQLAVMAQCRLSEPPEPADVADAIAIALCAARRIAEPRVTVRAG